MVPLALLVIAALVDASPAPAASIAPATNAAAAAQPIPKRMPPVIINGVLFQGVEFDTGKAVWRNLAITVSADRIDAWRALPVAAKNGYAEQMIETYRSAMKFDRDIKLSFIDANNTTLDQYLWTPPTPAAK